MRSASTFTYTIQGKTMLLHLRHMHEADLDAIYAIETSVHKTPWTLDILQECVKVGYDCRVLELIKGETQTIIGYLICRYTQTSCHLLNLAIHTPMQRQGYGKIMLDRLLASLSRPGISTVNLEVRPSNVKAIKLYSKMGFEEVAIKKDYYIDKTSREDAVVLSKKLI